MTQTNGNMNQENHEEVVLSFGKTELPYTVPQGYFETLAEDVMAEVQLQYYTKEVGFTVPAGYFDNFAETVMQKIKQQSVSEHSEMIIEELKDIAPLLTTISRENVYTVPEGYFDNFTVKGRETKIISINESRQKTKKSTWKGMAVAASLLLAVLTIGLFTNRNVDNNTPTNITRTQNSASYATSAAISIDSIKPSAQNTRTYLGRPATQNENGGVKYVEPQKLNVINVSEEINSISSKDLEEYLNSTPAIN